MIKDIIDANNNVTVGAKEIEILKEHFPACFRNGSFDIERLKEYLKDKIHVTEEGYELRFLGKNYARLLASLDTTTVIVPDEEHNNLPENKDSKNIYISGDNLDALKHLLKSYAGSIKCIYIDPPYNTGSDDFVYTDSFNFTVEELASKLSISEEQASRVLDLTRRGSATHSAWLMFMLPRLLLARDLLSKDGVIFISIDDNEQSNLRLLCDDIFGEENFLSILARRTKSGGGSAADSFAVEHDYICAYARDVNYGGKLFIPFTEEYLKRYSEEDEHGKYFWDTMERSSTKTRPYTITAPDGTELTGKWFRSKERFLKDKEIGEIRFLKKNDGNWSVQFKQRLAPGKKMRTLLYENDFKSYSDDLDELGLAGTFSYPKTVYLIQYLLQVVDNGGIVLDFFSGSATTAQAVMAENIKRSACQDDALTYIMVQIPENLDEKVVRESGDTREIAKKAISKLDECHRPHSLDYIGIERIIRAAKKYQSENSLFSLNYGFKHFTLQEPTNLSIEKMERFEPQTMFGDKTLVDEFGVPTILTTWLVRDGYGLTSDVKTLNIEGYELYYIDKHLYIINPSLSNEVVASLLDRYQSDAGFNPQNIVIYGYALSWAELQGLKDSLRVIRDGEKNMRINFDVRY